MLNLDRWGCVVLKCLSFSPLLILLALLPCSTWAEWHSESASIMGTDISVSLWHEDAVVAEKAIDAVMGEMRRIDGTLSPYKPGSELSRVNREAATSAQPISSEMAMLVDKSLYFSRVSGGAFDITFASIGQLYDYRKNKKPTEAERKALLAAINYRHLRLDSATQTLRYTHPDIKIDLGGIAKGHAVDNAAKILTSFGVEHATVSAGGDSRVLGDRRGRPWIIGIKNPRTANMASGADPTAIRMPLENVAVSTSGDYERFFIDEASGERVHHILNPRTGKSASEVMSVTVLGPLGVDTDPLSTTVFVLGIKKGLALINRLPGFDCVIIDRKGSTHYSEDLVAPPVN